MSKREDLLAALTILDKQDATLAERLRLHFKNEIEGTVVLKNGEQIIMPYVSKVKEAYRQARVMDEHGFSYNRQRVAAIKKLRECTGYSLKEACEAVDELVARGIL